MSSIKNGFFSNLKSDLPASIVVFLVAMPLCLGIATASGAPPIAGLIAGITGGIVVTLFSGSAIGVSGPAAGLIAIVAPAIIEFGFKGFLVSVIIAGILQLILGFIRAGIIGYYFPSSVIKGMLSGIGIIIILKEIPHALGFDKDPIGDFKNNQADGETTFSEIINIFNQPENISISATVIMLVSLAILILWERSFMTKLSFTKVIKGPLVAVVAGIGLTAYFSSNADLSLSSDHLVNIPTSDSISDFSKLITTPDFSILTNSRIYIIGIIIAVVASLETLLCVEATDKLDPHKRVTPTNKELKAQGIGNIVSGFIGGLPITQVIVRSSANIQSGGQTKASAFFHGILLLVSILTIPHIINLIPLASLAAILFIVGYKLAKPSLFKEMYHKGKEQFLPFVITIVAIVLTDLLVGIGIGLVVAIFFILWKNYQTPYHFEEKDYEQGKPIRIKLAEDVSFLNKVNVLQTLNDLPNGVHVIIDGSKTRSIHLDVIEIIDDFKINAEERDIKLEIIGLDSVNENGNNSVKELQKTVLEKRNK